MQDNVVTKVVSEVFSLLSTNLRQLASGLPDRVIAELEEIRVRVGLPLTLVTSSTELFVTPSGTTSTDPQQGYRPSGDDVDRTVQVITGSSVYAVEHELRQGYLSVPGGHRVGVCGQVVLDEQGIRTMRSISSLSIRVARQMVGVADGVLPYMVDHRKPLPTLIISPPQAGKTTLLRDIIRQVSTGKPSLGLRGRKVGVVDERGELAASYCGCAQNDLGPRTDVLDGCPKVLGLSMLVRSMSPEVIATDEIGGLGDLEALLDAKKSGVIAIATAHAGSLDELVGRPSMRDLVVQGLFARYIILSRRHGPGTIEACYGSDGQTPVGKGVGM